MMEFQYTTDRMLAKFDSIPSPEISEHEAGCIARVRTGDTVRDDIATLDKVLRRYGM